MSGWRTSLRAASFRGARFYIDTSGGTYGRRIADHEYPGRDTPFAEDLGRKQRTWNFTGYVLGNRYLAERDRLVAACEEKGPGELVLPSAAAVQAVCRTCTLGEERARGGIATFTLEFGEAGKLREPGQTTNPDSQVTGAADNLGTVAPAGFTGGAAPAAGGALALVVAASGTITDSLGAMPAPHSASSGGGFSVAGAGPWVAQAAIDDIHNLADALQALRLPGAGLPQGPIVLALDYLRSAAETLVAYPAQLAEAIDRAFAGFTDAGDAGPVVAAMLTLATEWRAGTPRGTSGLPPDRPSIIPPMVGRNGYPSQRMWAPTQRARNAAIFETYTHELALREVGYAVTGMDFDHYDHATSVRDTITAVFIDVEEVTADAGQDDIFSALAELRAAITRMIGIRAANLNPLITYRTPGIANSLTLAWRMYQDADRDLEVCDRVAARNPSFLPIAGRILAGGQ